MSKSINNVNILDLVNVLYAAADFSSPMPNLINSTERLIYNYDKSLRPISVLALVNIGWSLAMMDQLKINIFDWVCRHLTPHIHLMTYTMKRQFFQVSLIGFLLIGSLVCLRLGLLLR